MTQKTKMMRTMDPIKTPGMSQVLAKGRQFLLLKKYPGMSQVLAKGEQFLLLIKYPLSAHIRFCVNTCIRKTSFPPVLRVECSSVHTKGLVLPHMILDVDNLQIML